MNEEKTLKDAINFIKQHIQFTKAILKHLKDKKSPERIKAVLVTAALNAYITGPMENDMKAIMDETSSKLTH